MAEYEHEKLYKEVFEVGKENRALYDRFAMEESDFVKGNGFTKEIVSKEQDIIARLDDYTQNKILPVLNNMANSGDENAEGYARVYKAALEFIHPMFVQRDLDNVLYTNNELRKRMEMWKVFERLPKGTSITKRMMQKAVDDEYKSWSKIERLKRTGAEIGGLDKMVSEWAAESALKAFKTAKDARDSERQSADAKKLTPQQKEDIKVQLAAMVLKSIIDIEKKKPVDAEKPHYDELIKVDKRGAGTLTYEELMKTRFMDMAKEVAKDPSFVRAYNKYMKGGNFNTKTIRFIADDMDKKLAQDLSKRAPVLQK